MGRALEAPTAAAPTREETVELIGAEIARRRIEDAGKMGHLSVQVAEKMLAEVLAQEAAEKLVDEVCEYGKLATPATRLIFLELFGSEDPKDVRNLPNRELRCEATRILMDGGASYESAEAGPVFKI